MAAVARALSSDEVLEGLLGAASPDAVVALPALVEADVPPDVTVRDVMTRSPVSVGPDTALGEAADLILKLNVRAVPVTGPGGEVLGILNDGHLLRHMLPQTVSQMTTGQMRAVKRKAAGKGVPVEPGQVPVREVMDRSVLCLEEDQTIADVAALMLSKDVDRFPVTRDGSLVGWLTRGDIVRRLLGK
jgi:CBS domain-containing protein